MAIRTARTDWTGTLQDGSGRVELVTSGVGTFDVSWPTRTSEGAEGSTSPEELIAAAHSSCFSMALSNEIAKAGGTPRSLRVTAEVTLDLSSGATITSSKLSVDGEVEGLDAAGFQQAAEAARVGCPVSKALGAIEISLDIGSVSGI